MNQALLNQRNKLTQASAIFLTLFFLLYSSISYGQKIIVVNEEEIGTKYNESPFTYLSIRPNIFQDGDYIFYFDSTKKNIFFKGKIINGLTNGVYYTYERNGSYEIISKTKASIQSINGKLNGVCKSSINECGHVRDGFTFHFDKGILTKIKVINPFFRGTIQPSLNGGGFYMQRDSHVPIDTLTFVFQNGKLESVHFYNNISFYKVQPALKNDCVKDTFGLKKLSSSEKYYVRNPEFKDSLGILFEKEYKFDDKATIWQKSIFIGYDSLININRLALISGYPTIVNNPALYGNRDEYTAYRIFLLEIEFDKNKCLRYIKYNNRFTEIDIGAEDGSISTNLTLNTINLYYLPGGVLDDTK